MKHILKISHFIFLNRNMKFILGAVIVLILQPCDLDGKQLPTFIQKCKRNDPQLSECLKEAISSIREHLQDGIKELKIFPFNPYTVPEAFISTTWMNITFTNIKIPRLHIFEINSLQVNLDQNPVIALTYSIPNMEMTAHYQLNGNLLQYQLQAEGEFESKFNKSRFSFSLDGKKIKEHGEEYLNLTRIDYNILELPFQHIYLHNLFEGNQELTDRINLLLLEDNDIFYKEFKPVIEKIVSTFIFSMFKGTFDTFSLDELFD